MEPCCMNTEKIKLKILCTIRVGTIVCVIPEYI